MPDRPFGRRSLLRGAGALTAATLGSGAPWTAGCAPDDKDALTFFFAANPDERDVRMRIIDEFQRRHPGIKVRPVLSAPGVMQQLATFCAGGKCPDVMMAWDLKCRRRHLMSYADPRNMPMTSVMVHSDNAFGVVWSA
jgi:ABC-type glycerol-3-phosphate transport system substrate-binding protein